MKLLDRTLLRLSAVSESRAMACRSTLSALPRSCLPQHASRPLAPLFSPPSAPSPADLRTFLLRSLPVLVRFPHNPPGSCTHLPRSELLESLLFLACFPRPPSCPPSLASFLSSPSLALGSSEPPLAGGAAHYTHPPTLCQALSKNFFSFFSAIL